MLSEPSIHRILNAERADDSDDPGDGEKDFFERGDRTSPTGMFSESGDCLDGRVSGPEEVPGALGQPQARPVLVPCRTWQPYCVVVICTMLVAGLDPR